MDNERVAERVAKSLVGAKDIGKEIEDIEGLIQKARKVSQDVKKKATDKELFGNIDVANKTARDLVKKLSEANQLAFNLRAFLK